MLPSLLDLFAHSGMGGADTYDAAIIGYVLAIWSLKLLSPCVSRFLRWRHGRIMERIRRRRAATASKML
jgi:hypothetical protein